MYRSCHLASEASTSWSVSIIKRVYVEVRLNIDIFMVENLIVTPTNLILLEKEDKLKGTMTTQIHLCFLLGFSRDAERAGREAGPRPSQDTPKTLYW